MEYRQIGNSNLKASVIGLGGNIFGYFTNLKETKKIIDCAFNQGINFIDTANVYSEGLSEKYIGESIKGNREKFIIATKAGLHSNEIPKNKFTYKYIVESAEESLKRLRTDYIDLYQVHNYDLSVPLEETMNALNELVDSGKVRYIGCSNYTLQQLKLSFNLKHKHKFVSLQSKYNLFERDIEKGIIDYCKKKNIGILVYSPLARGLLTGKYKRNIRVPEHFRAFKSQSLHSQLTDEFFDVSEKLNSFAKEKGISMNGLSLSWLLSKPEISSLIAGIRTPEQLISNLKFIDARLDKKDMKQIDFLLNKFTLS